MQATELLGWSRREMSEAIAAGEVELWTTPVGSAGVCAVSVLARELDGIASAHIEKLSAALPGFAETIAFPAG